MHHSIAYINISTGFNQSGKSLDSDDDFCSGCWMSVTIYNQQHSESS